MRVYMFMVDKVDKVDEVDEGCGATETYAP